MKLIPLLSGTPATPATTVEKLADEAPTQNTEQSTQLDIHCSLHFTLKELGRFFSL